MTTAVRLDKRDRAIRGMFAAVAPRYDLLNHLLSASLDRVWRRRAAVALEIVPGTTVLDLCCGTGDQAIALERRGAAVVATDFCLPMLAIAAAKYRRRTRRPPTGLSGTALALPFRNGAFGGATVSFGLRNVADLDGALGELQRVLRPGARLAVLEFSVPRNRALRRAYLLYFQHLLPRLGALLSPHGSAYAYLPASVVDFPQRRDFASRLRAAGFEDITWEELSMGIVNLYLATRAAQSLSTAVPPRRAAMGSA